MNTGIRTAPNEEVPGSAPKPLPWKAIAWFSALLAVCYGSVIWHMAGQWMHNDDMGHGFFVPFVAAYIVWQRRDRLMQARIAPNWWGLAVVALGAAQLYIATLGAELFLARTAFIVSLAGIVLLLCGFAVLRLVAFPLFLLFFMVPLPAVIYNQITFKLQLLASRLAETALALLGIPVLREGNILELASQRLSVVEACSGIRSLLTLSFLSLVYGYFFERKVAVRIALLIATVPIALVANAGRVTVTGILSEIKPELAEGLLHTASGWFIFMIGLGLLILVHRSINLGYHILYARK